ncbi:hypothetical protein HCB17_25590, partial [Salinispora arenicola]|nr:hypothetical protein [Salinispora arenicola]
MAMRYDAAPAAGTGLPGDAAQRVAELQRHWPARAAEAVRADEKPPRTAAS